MFRSVYPRSFDVRSGGLPDSFNTPSIVTVTIQGVLILLISFPACAGMNRALWKQKRRKGSVPIFQGKAYQVPLPAPF